jgi:hypothetical protein
MLSSVLTSLLPGVREVRTPLTAGYIWLTLGWLAWGSNVPTNRPEPGMFASLWDIGVFIGKGGGDPRETPQGCTVRRGAAGLVRVPQ